MTADLQTLVTNLGLFLLAGIEAIALLVLCGLFLTLLAAVARAIGGLLK